MVHKSQKSSTKLLLRLAKDARVRRAVITMIPVIVGFIKNRRKNKKR